MREGLEGFRKEALDGSKERNLSLERWYQMGLKGGVAQAAHLYFSCFNFYL